MKLVANAADVEVDDRLAKTLLPWALRDVIAVHGATFPSGAGSCVSASLRSLRQPSAQPRPYEGGR
jgi:hypothetical protein